MSQPVADMLTCVLATVIASGILKELKQLEGEYNSGKDAGNAVKNWTTADEI